jgi:hypothetical protein
MASATSSPPTPIASMPSEHAADVRESDPTNRFAGNPELLHVRCMRHL